MSHSSELSVYLSHGFPNPPSSTAVDDVDVETTAVGACSVGDGVGDGVGGNVGLSRMPILSSQHVFSQVESSNNSQSLRLNC